MSNETERNNDKYIVDCCNEECGWTGFSTDCGTFKHDDKLLCIAIRPLTFWEKIKHFRKVILCQNL